MVIPALRASLAAGPTGPRRSHRDAKVVPGACDEMSPGTGALMALLQGGAP